MVLRSKFCSSTQMLSAVKCMGEDFADEDHNLSMWANGGRETDMPEPTLIRHQWINSDTAITYTITAIHLSRFDKQPHWSYCALDSGASYAAAMVTPAASTRSPRPAAVGPSRFRASS